MRPVFPALIAAFFLWLPLSLAAQTSGDGFAEPEQYGALDEILSEVPLMDIPADLPPPPPAESAPALIPEVPSSAAQSYAAAPPRPAKVIRVVSDMGDMARLRNIVNNNDPEGRMGWSISDTAFGPGIEADDEGRLVGLNLPDKGLSSLLSFNGSEHLTELKSRGNPFTGFKLSALPELRILNITGSRLTQLRFGDFMSLPNLTWLELPGNQIESIDPRIFSDLGSLESLHLTGNRLTTLRSFTFAGLTKLTELFLDKNRLKTLERGLFEPLGQLVTLNLSGNSLVKLADGDLLGLKLLEVLNLDDNQISSIAPEAFRNQELLKFLNLSGNALTAINPKILRPLTELIEVDLTGNRLPPSEMLKAMQAVSETAAVQLNNQRDVYFGLRVHLRSRLEAFEIPAADATVNGTVTHVEAFGSENDGTVYEPPAGAELPGRLVFRKPGVYNVFLSNDEISFDPDVSSVTGRILVLDAPFTDETAMKLTGGVRKKATTLLNTLINLGCLEITPDDHHMIEVLTSAYPELVRQ